MGAFGNAYDGRVPCHEPYQQEVDQVMEAKGYTRGKDWLILKFKGAEHGERAWRARVHRPLEFLLGRDGQ